MNIPKEERAWNLALQIIPAAVVFAEEFEHVDDLRQKASAIILNLLKEGHMTRIEALNSLAAEIHETAVSKGWWETDRNDGEMICLMHSELSEALEAIRAGNPPDDKIPEFSGAEAELADCIIRILDAGYARNWRIAEAVLAKMEMNKTRAYKHGGKTF